MKTRFRMVMIAHPGPGIGFHKRFMWRIIIPPTMERRKGGTYLVLRNMHRPSTFSCHWRTMPPP